jgi:SRSO17 transposase
VPAEVRFRTRQELALEMLDERGSLLPHAWVAGDDEMGRCSWFREQLRQRGERYLLAVPANTSVRNLAAPNPPYSGRGPHPRVPFRRVDRWCLALPETAWQTIEVRNGEKGPLVVEATWLLVQARTQRRPSKVPELLVIFRERQGKGTWKHDYLLSNASLLTPLEEWARVYKAEHRIEECLKRAKREAGLGDYQVRTWEGWYHHQVLSLLAAWFLTQETRRGKNPDASVDRAAGTSGDGADAESVAGLRSVLLPSANDVASFTTQRGGEVLPLEATQPLATATI